jgi:hypothetical protein
MLHNSLQNEGSTCQTALNSCCFWTAPTDDLPATLLLRVADQWLSLVSRRCLDKAAIESEAGPHVTLTEVEESKAFFGILPLFLCICIYQMTYVSVGQNDSACLRCAS